MQADAPSRRRVVRGDMPTRRQQSKHKGRCQYVVAFDVSDGELVKLGKESKTRCIQVACKRRRMIVDALETTM
jgi:predicted Fe-Mo cluster-binding NifX family protein